MLNYTFRCTACDEHFEIRQSLAEHERHKEKCPKCGSKKVERHFQQGVQVKTSKKS